MSLILPSVSEPQEELRDVEKATARLEQATRAFNQLLADLERKTNES